MSRELEIENPDNGEQPPTRFPFHQRFDIGVGLEDARNRFVCRVMNWTELLLPELQEHYINRKAEYDQILQLVANELGIRYEKQHRFEDYVAGDFVKALQALEALRKVTNTYEGDETQLAEVIVERAMSQSEIDLEVEWSDGEFKPSGAKLLDSALVNENLRQLSDQKYANVLKPFDKGLHHFIEAQGQPEKLADTVTDMYEALESLAKIITDNDKDLSSNREAFVSALELSDDYYKKMLRDYVAYANEYRHGAKSGKQKPPLKLYEVEAFIYTTGLFVRLAIRAQGEQT